MGQPLALLNLGLVDRIAVSNGAPPLQRYRFRQYSGFAEIPAISASQCAQACFKS